ncbi:regulatory protein RecX [Dickeya lacustris]|uniref:Regulatory protein RecX n=1 Tax=Dickeya lacustris TaxID=2259638 RepID=A0ABY8GAM6_9GAMM|nr:regulatory protein RecX [Dickeya lacustris]WFN57003.1 regulatory protein RecX [Dickeya lacustris]
MSDILRYAMNVLAVRDHSERELRRKITAYLHSSCACAKAENGAVNEQVECALNYCRQQGWLDDERYASRYISSRSRKGYGLQRIAAELHQRGIDKLTQHQALLSCDIDWQEQIKTVANRKFGTALPTDWSSRLKVQRYLLYRGFSHDDIQSLYMNFSD